MIHTVWVVTPDQYLHSACFQEAAEAMRDALEELQGSKVEIVTDGYRYCEQSTLVFGAHLLPKPSFEADLGKVIIYNSEEISDQGGWISPTYLVYMRRHEVWDFSPLNVQRLKEKYGIEAKYVPLGYMPCLTRIPETQPSCDVLFYGCNNPRRDKILTELQGKCNLVYLAPGIYGEQRDSYIARAKIVLNIHFYQPKIFEIFRCSHLLANKKFIVSEYGADEDLESSYDEGIWFTRYENIVGDCLDFLKKDKERNRIAKEGFEIFSKQSQVEILRGVLQ